MVEVLGVTSFVVPETGFSAAIVREVREGMTPLVAFLNNQPFPSID